MTDARSSDDRRAALARSMHWSYAAPQTCPQEAHFVEQVASRIATPPARPGASPAQRKLEVRVVVEGNASAEWAGSVEIDGVEGNVERQVRGATCDEVVVALALITSFWIDPEDAVPPEQATALTSKGPLPEELFAGTDAPRAHTPPLLASNAVKDVPADATPARDAFVVASEAPALTDSEDAADAGHAVAPSVRQQLLHVIGHVGYSSSPGGLARAGVRFELWGSSSAASWAGAATLSYAYGLQDGRLGTSELMLALAHADLCAPGYESHGKLWVRPCAFGRAGPLRFQAPAESLNAARARWRPWAAAGLGLHLGFRMSPQFSLRMLGELSANLVRDYFETNRVVAANGTSLGQAPLYRPGSLAFDLGFGVSYEF